MADLLLSLYSGIAGKKAPPEWQPVYWKNLYFPNPIGPAGGMDKSAKHLKAWWALGAGFIEVGTVTPLPQSKNRGPTLKRDWKRKALWNHLGFPGDGVEKIKQRLKKIQSFRPTPVFANIGKNRQTKNEQAHIDYIQCISALHPYVDGFVINISSPNTKNLTNLAKPTALKKLLQDIKQKLNSFEQIKPFLIKWSPDLNEKEFLQSLDVALKWGAEGHIICNTSTKREANSPFPDYGGVSGAPLSHVSKKKLQLITKHLNTEKKNQLLISVGGIIEPKDISERMKLGADLVQVYSALVFQSPFFFRQAFQYHTK